MIRRQLVVAVRLVAVATAIGLGYSLVATGLASVLFGDQARGSEVRVDGAVVGSKLVGQVFTRPAYFHARPSAGDSDGRASWAANLGPSNPELAAVVRARLRAYRRENQLSAGAVVPVDAVTSSASGLDPHISVANARLQASRVARARGLPADRVLALVDARADSAPLWLGPRVVNVLELNLALDRGDKP